MGNLFREGLLSHILDALPVGVWITDAEGQRIASNPAAHAIWGGNHWIGLRPTDRFKARWAQTGKPVELQERALYRALHSGEAVLEQELEIEGFDGSHRTILNSAFPLRDRFDKVIGAVVVNQDITERKRIEAALRDSEVRARAILDNAADGILIADRRGVIVSLNPAAAAIFGYAPEALVGQNIRQLIPRPYLVEHESYHDLAPSSSVPQRVNSSREVVGRRRSGESISLDLAVTEMSLGGQILFNAIVRDNTERTRAQEELARSHAMLRALAARLQSIREEERTRIAREVHDDLGQALTGLKMDLAWLAPRLAADQSLVAERVQDMTALVEQTIHTVRRIATELRPGVLDNLGLVAALEWQAADFQTRTGIPCHFRAGCDDLGVDLERRSAMFRIFQEALTNITRHARATRVDVAFEEREACLRLEVRDNGVGMDAGQAAQPTALGLLGMHERAIMFGGEVSIQSAPGQGTTVQARIPLAGTPGGQAPS